MSYKLTDGGWPQHIESGVFVNPETNAEYLAWLAEGNTPAPADPPPPPDKKQEALSLSQQMMASGFFKVQALMSINYFIDKIKALPEASGLTDEQITVALTDPESPFYNADFVKVQTYYNDLMAL